MIKQSAMKPPVISYNVTILGENSFSNDLLKIGKRHANKAEIIPKIIPVLYSG